MSNTGTVYADNAVINRRDELFFWSNDFAAGGDVLYRAEPSTQSIVALDTFRGPIAFREHLRLLHQYDLRTDRRSIRRRRQLETCDAQPTGWHH